MKFIYRKHVVKPTPVRVFQCDPFPKPIS